ncbi:MULTISPECIES: sulfate/molybdate ABC transporter ATP-binding protein [Pseudomonas]|uniref:Sulfate ABC transporter ATP-binding protein n=1 Tax=Pseudomonas neustonica TaxID=2487346 RepID=A0ABX9XJH3_9PSED|nr:MULTISPECIES: TOBE-like domain-containing protein [Pseudomonas]MBA6421753.1 TOBE-like domain-containing protein [Pseudomonas sp. 5Ae-yellow]ROZ81624.1 sulfate ABC transporter ATP-binding protein [Pseudomonas sp. SSM44]ROZ83382.1 sulfate ABC transporter ATP-binding protein [Pseudomonas neustonica]|tara:strand:+ start:2920 stop:4020 length:1101 start_codon:yes stop_codon:yes gene_type:complete
MSIRLEGINKYFGQFQALKDISLDIPDGQLTGLLGPSGSGKTTLLRIIAGLESAEQGRILFHGEDVTDLHVRDRRVGFVFQHYALFRHMTVAQNIAFGLEVMPKAQRPGAAEIRKQVGELLDMVQLAHLASRYPAQLSGGQKQRIALARALAMKPEILLLDEPFGALDAKVRKDLRRWLRALHDELHFTSVFVTHDQEEALELSDSVVVMSAGKVEQVGGPQALYAQPESRFVFDFLGHVNVLDGQLAQQRMTQGDAWVQLPGMLECSGEAQLYLRPHEVRLQDCPAPHANLPLRIESISLIGAEVRLELAPCGWVAQEPWEVGISHVEFNRWQPQRGDRCYAVPDVGHLFDVQQARPRTLSWVND